MNKKDKIFLTTLVWKQIILNAEKYKILDANIYHNGIHNVVIESIYMYNHYLMNVQCKLKEGICIYQIKCIDGTGFFF